MTTTPGVSIIMPVYNAMPFLPAAVQSIFAQTLTDWELLAVDDGSTDGSWEYLQRIDDPRVRIARNERNCGAPTTINRCIDMARSRYAARMDADDIILPRRLELQLAAMEAHPEVDALGTGGFLVDRELNLAQVRWPVTEHKQIVRRPTLYYPLTFGALMGKTEWWRKWRVDPRIGIAGYEFDLYLRSHRDSVFSNVPDPVYVYRFIGHTRSWTKMTKSAYYKGVSLVRHGFKPGLTLWTLFALASLLPRPLLYAVKLAIGSNTGLVSAGATPPTEQEKTLLKEGLEQVARVTVPLKPAK